MQDTLSQLKLTLSELGWDPGYPATAVRRELAVRAMRQVEDLVDLAGGLAAAASPPIAAAAVLTVPAAQVRLGDRLIVDLDLAHEFGRRPQVSSIERTDNGTYVFGVPGGFWWATGACRMLIERPPDPGSPEPGPAAHPEPQPAEEDDPVAVAAAARILDEHERPGSPVADPERGVLWLPTRPWSLPRRVRGAR